MDAELTGPVELTARAARRIALAAQGFAGARPSGRIDRRHFRKVLQQLATVQLDSINVLTRSHELVFFARIGAYDREALSRWLWSSREVFEYWGHEASVHPVDRHPLFRWRMDGRHHWGLSDKADQHADLLEQTRRAVLDNGPIGISELQDATGDRRNGEPWWGWTPTKQLAEHLFWNGEITATRRNGFERAYLAPEKWLPARILEAPTPSEAEAQRQLLLIAARAHGVGTARDLADYYRLPIKPATARLRQMVDDGELLAAQVEGWRQPAFLHPDARRPRRALKARALLSPFDSLIWERQRTERLWGFRYRIEVYVPAAKRVHGYYVLPFLLGEHLVARVDLKADRRAGVLRVRSAWAEWAATDRPHDAPDRETVADALATELQAMADWLGLSDGVAVDGHGDLAPALRRCVQAHHGPPVAMPDDLPSRAEGSRRGDDHTVGTNIGHAAGDDDDEAAAQSVRLVGQLPPQT